MRIADNLEIHFHQQDQVSIFLESSESGSDQRVAETALAAFFAIRTLSNLGVNQTSDSLATALGICAQGVDALAAGATTGGFQLVPYPGNPGRKSFFAKLRVEGTNVRLDYTYKGFGWLGTGLGYYAPTAVMALVRFLAQKNRDDNHFLNALGTTLAACGQFHMRRQITLTNHAALAMPLIAMAWATESGDSTWRPDAGIESTEDTEFMGIANRVLEFVTMMAADTDSHRPTQRFAPTFVMAAANVLRIIHQRREFRMKDAYTMGDLTSLIAHLNVWAIVANFASKVPIDRLEETIRGLGYAYHMTDVEILEWQSFLHRYHGAEDVFGRSLFRFSRISEPFGRLEGDLSVRSLKWPEVLAEIWNSYTKLLNSPAWIADVDAALDRAAPRETPK